VRKIGVCVRVGLSRASSREPLDEAIERVFPVRYNPQHHVDCAALIGGGSLG
jgi:hypothetical protein